MAAKCSAHVEHLAAFHEKSFVPILFIYWFRSDQPKSRPIAAEGGVAGTLQP
jgi:hypothetical protein